MEIHTYHDTAAFTLGGGDIIGETHTKKGTLVVLTGSQKNIDAAIAAIKAEGALYVKLIYSKDALDAKFNAFATEALISKGKTKMVDNVYHAGNSVTYERVDDTNLTITIT